MHSKSNILIIDDDNDFIDLYTQVFETSFNVSTVNTLKEALTKISKDPFKFDLILCDIFMPQTSGFEVFDFFKSQTAFRHLNIIFKTSSLNESIIEESIIHKKTELISTYMSNSEILARIKKSILETGTVKVRDLMETKLVISKETNKLIFPSYSIPIEFTQTEINILETLSRTTNYISKGQLIKSAFRKNTVITNNNYNTTLTNLRKKLQPIGISLTTKRNLGTGICF